MAATTARDRSKVLATGVAVVVAVAGIVASGLATVPVLLAVDPTGAQSLSGFALLFLANYAGMALTVVLYLVVAGRGLSYLDVSLPGVRDLGYVLGGTVAAFLAVATVGALVTLLGLETTPNAVLEPALGGNTDLLLLLVPLVLFVNAPVEELLFRNVVQKRLYGAFSRAPAVVVASAIFAAVHAPAYYDFANPNLEATAVSIAVIFAGSLVFGWTYARTDNVVVPSAVHGLFNAVQIGLLYVALEQQATLGAVRAGVRFAGG